MVRHYDEHCISWYGSYRHCHYSVGGIGYLFRSSVEGAMASSNPADERR